MKEAGLLTDRTLRRPAASAVGLLTLRVMKEVQHQNKLASRMREHAGSRPRFLMPARGAAAFLTRSVSEGLHC